MLASVIALLSALSAIACAPRAKPPRRPRVVVLIVVDQMRADYLQRFGSRYESGLARLISKGTVYSAAHQAHAFTLTACGHATLATGVSPARNGIVGNSWWERSERRRVGSVADPSTRILDAPETTGASPFRLRTTGLADWLRAASPRSSVWSVAIKDRSAVLPAGAQPDGALWYDHKRGRFVTSDYYMDRTPTWLDDFNAHGPVEDFRAGWNLLHDETRYTHSREDAYAAEGHDATFPHKFSAGAAYYADLVNSPFGDRLTLALATRLLREEALGTDEAPDLLLVGLSSADSVGHTYGPFSREIEDYYVRLDRMLGEFFDELDARVGRDRWLVVLSSDHGAVPLPEESRRQGRDAVRQPWGETRARVEAELQRVVAERGLAADSVRLHYANGWVFEADKTISATQLSELRTEMARALLAWPRVEDVFTWDELAAERTNGRPFQELYRAAFDAERSADLAIRFREYDLPNAGSSGTSHGSVYAYDTQVPLIFLGAGASRRQVDSTVRSVDVAPTIARCLGIEFPADLDGSPLAELCR